MKLIFLTSSSKSDSERGINTLCLNSSLAVALIMFATCANGLLAQRSTAPEQEGSNDLSAEIVTLSKFVVSIDEDGGYRATDTLAGTHIKTNLKDIGSSLSVITKQFMEDVGARGVEDLLVYTLGTEVGGTSGNFGGAGNGVVLTERNSVIAPDTLTRVRGLAGVDNTRDLFLTDIPWDTYNVERIELQRGPNSILFGLGSPGGVLNASAKQAGFKKLTKLEARIDNEGSFRASLDLNRELIEDQLAVRLNLLNAETKYQQEPAYKDDQRLAFAMRLDPAFLNKGSAHTSLRVSYEGGEIQSNNPRSMLPMDRLTPWFETGTTTVGNKTYNNLDQFTGDFRYRSAYFADVPGSGFFSASSPNYQPAIQDANNGNYTFFDMQTAGSGAPTGPYYVGRTAYTDDYGLGANGSIDGTIQGLYGNNKLVMVSTTSEWAKKLKLPFANAYKNKSLTDRSIFDYFNLLIDGPNKSENRDFDAKNVTLSQTFWHGKVGIEGAYDRQSYQEINDAPFYGLGTGDSAITVDVNTHLPDGSLNSNVGRPVLIQRTVNGGFGRDREREAKSLKAYVELAASDIMNDSWLERLLGRHVFTGGLREDSYEQQTDSWASAAVTSNGTDIAANEAIKFRRELSMFSYLGPDMRGLSSPSGLGLSNVQNPLTFGENNIVFFDSHWNQPTDPTDPGYVDPGADWTNPFNNQVITQSENPANYVGWQSVPTNTLSLANGDHDQLTFQSSKTRSEVESQYFVWQGYFWDGLVVPMFGYREDTAKSYYKLAPLYQPSGLVDFSSPGYDFDSNPTDVVTGETKSYSLVIHTPEFIRNRLPLGLDFSLLYNKSSNFQPVAGRTDMLGIPIGSPSGNTEEFGVVVSMLSDKLRFKATKYTTSLKDSSYQPQRMWRLMTTEKLAWVKAKQYEAGLTGNPEYEGAQYNYGTFIDGVFTQSAAQRSQQAQDVEAVLSQFDPQLWAAWNLEATDSMWQLDDQLATPIPPGMNGTVDSVSRGYELELDYAPVPGWNIAFNAARADAVRSNVGGKTMTELIADRHAQWNGPAGQLLRGGTSINTIGDYWNDFYSDYTLDRLLEGSSAAEVRRWRFNLINNYRFTEGRLKGLSLGGAYRWQDKVTIGYPSIYVDVDGKQLESFDIQNPYYGPIDESVDIWVGYQQKIGDRCLWKIKLNVRNAFGRDEIIPINSQPDGGPAAFRIRNGTSWFVTNSFEF